MNRPAITHFSLCAREDLRRLAFHLRGLVRSIFQRQPN